MSKQSLSLIIFTILVVHIGIILNVTAVDPAPMAATAAGEHVFELYMHDILGGSNPTARPVTGFRAPQGGVVIPNANGAILNVNANGVPLGTGLVGTQFAAAGNQNQNNIQNQIPAQLGPDGLGLGFGTITVIDDLLTIDSKLGSQSLGKAQGVYVSSLVNGSRQMMTFTAMMEGGEYGDSINFFGVYHIGSPMSRLSVTGGTGKFLHACGFAEVRSLIPAGKIVADGVESLLRLTVHLSY